MSSEWVSVVDSQARKVSRAKASPGLLARKLALKRWEEIEAGGDDDERARDFLDERDRKISDAFRGDLCFDDDDARFGYFYDDEMDDSADSSDSDEGSELDAPLGERAGHYVVQYGLQFCGSGRELAGSLCVETI